MLLTSSYFSFPAKLKLRQRVTGRFIMFYWPWRVLAVLTEPTRQHQNHTLQDAIQTHIRYTLSQLYISSSSWRSQSPRIWAIPAKVTWKKSAGIIKPKLSKKCLRFTNRSLQHREVKGPAPGHAKSCFQRGLNINLPSPPWRLKCDLFALRQEHTLLSLLLFFMSLFPFF